MKGTHAWQGLGTIHFQQSGKADPRQRTDIIQAEVRHLEGEGRRSRALELGSPSGTHQSGRSCDLNFGDWSPFASLSYSYQCMTLFQHQQICTGEEWRRTHRAGYVEGEARWLTYWRDARPHLARGDIDAVMVLRARSSPSETMRTVERAERAAKRAERASCWLWNRQEELSWKPGGDGLWLAIPANSVPEDVVIQGRDVRGNLHTTWRHLLLA